MSSCFQYDEGEFVGYFAGANILMEYVLSNAAVARSFTEYLCHAVGVNNSDSWRVEVEGLVHGYNKLDFPAVALILLLTLCLCHRFDLLQPLMVLIFLRNMYSVAVFFLLGGGKILSLDLCLATVGGHLD